MVEKMDEVYARRPVRTLMGATRQVEKMDEDYEKAPEDVLTALAELPNGNDWRQTHICSITYLNCAAYRRRYKSDAP